MVWHLSGLFEGDDRIVQNFSQCVTFLNTFHCEAVAIDRRRTDKCCDWGNGAPSPLDVRQAVAHFGYKIYIEIFVGLVVLMELLRLDKVRPYSKGRDLELG